MFKLGKHERQEIENAERLVVDLLNNKKISTEQKSNKWIRHAKELKSTLTKDFGNIQQAEHVGNTYGEVEIGDVKFLVKDNSDWIYIELKMSESKKGKGTLANISQDALTTSKLFSNKDILSWSQFRNNNNFSQLILGELNKFSKYPSNLNKKSINQQIINKAAFLKKKFLTFIKKKQSNVANIICK